MKGQEIPPTARFLERGQEDRFVRFRRHQGHNTGDVLHRLPRAGQERRGPKSRISGNPYRCFRVRAAVGAVTWMVAFQAIEISCEIGMEAVGEVVPRLKILRVGKPMSAAGHFASRRCMYCHACLTQCAVCKGFGSSVDSVSQST